MQRRTDPRNVGDLDRAARISLGVGLLCLLAVGPVPGWGLWGLLGLVPAATGIMGFCPAYSLLRKSTRPVPARARTGRGGK